MPITAHENTTISDIIAALHGYKVLMAIKTKFIAPFLLRPLHTWMFV